MSPLRSPSPLVVVAVLLAAVAALPALADEPARGEHLVLVTENGALPTRLEVRPGDLVVWINRSATALVAIAFSSEETGATRDCPGARAFRRVSGTPPFTSLLAPGTVAALCAPSAAGEHRYELSGDASAEAWLVVVEETS